jgi:hypothetical protein
VNGPKQSQKLHKCLSAPGLGWALAKYFARFIHFTLSLPVRWGDSCSHLQMKELRLKEVRSFLRSSSEKVLPLLADQDLSGCADQAVPLHNHIH